MNKVTDLADEIIQFAKAHGLSLCVAESCSAGVLAQAFSQAEGASEQFKGGVVTYTKDAKMNVLGVPPQLIAKGTAVCGEMAEAMASGAIGLFDASLAVSLTGVAGPEPDEDGNPVGLVYCAVARNDGTSKHVELRCKGLDRDAVVDEACVEALRLLRSFAFS